MDVVVALLVNQRKYWITFTGCVEGIFSQEAPEQSQKGYLLERIYMRWAFIGFAFPGVDEFGSRLQGNDY